MDTNAPIESNIHKRHIFKYLKIFIIVLTVFVGIKGIEALKQYSYIGSGVAPTNIITVSGKGEVLAKPDIADFSFSVSEDGTTAQQAQDKASVKVNAALDAVKAARVEDKDVKTISYNLFPKYDYGQPCVYSANSSGVVLPCVQRSPKIIGYTVSQSVEVKVRKIDDASGLLTKITKAGVSNISGINFVLDDQDALMEQAKGMAIADAKDKAQVLAKQLGVHLVRIVSFSDQNGGPIYYGGVYGMDSVSSGKASAPTPELPAGENKITSNVSITYEIN